MFWNPVPMIASIEAAAADLHRSRAAMASFKEEQEGRERARAAGPEALLAYEKALAEVKALRVEQEEKRRRNGLEDRRGA